MYNENYKREGDYVQKRIKLGEILLAAGAITKTQLEHALTQQKINGKRLGETLIELKYITEPTMLVSMEKQLELSIKSGHKV